MGGWVGGWGNERRTRKRASTASSSSCLYWRQVSIMRLSAGVKGPRDSSQFSTTGSICWSGWVGGWVGGWMEEDAVCGCD